MPKCNKCQNAFPNILKIDGKERYLHKRKYCLTCSPFNEHNTKKIEVVDQGLTCKTCNKLFDYKRQWNSHDECRSCKVNKRRHSVKKRAVDYKGGKCKVCGYDKCLRALQFHHLDPKIKDFQISGKHCLSWAKIVKELDKCALLCNRCHSEVHEGITEIPGVS